MYQVGELVCHSLVEIRVIRSGGSTTMPSSDPVDGSIARRAERTCLITRDRFGAVGIPKVPFRDSREGDGELLSPR